MTTDSLLILNDLIRAHGETSACYRQAAERADDADEQARLAETASQRRAYAEELLDRVAHLGGQFAVRVSLSSAAPPDGEGADPLAAAERIESRARMKYQEALAEPIDAETHRILRTQYNRLDRLAA